MFSVIRLLPLWRNSGAQCFEKLQVVRWAEQRCLLLAITPGGGQCQDLNNKFWGRSLNTHLGLTENRNQLQSLQMDLGFGRQMDLFVRNQNDSLPKAASNCGFHNGCSGEGECSSSSWLIYSYWYSSTKVTAKFVHKDSFLHSHSRNICFLRGKLAVNH